MLRPIAENVALTSEHASFVAAQVASGRYACASEVVRAALNSLARQEARRPIQQQGTVNADRV